MLDLQTVSENVFVDLNYMLSFFGLKYEFNVLGNILLKKLKADK